MLTIPPYLPFKIGEGRDTPFINQNLLNQGIISIGIKYYIRGGIKVIIYSIF